MQRKPESVKILKVHSEVIQNRNYLKRIVDVKDAYGDEFTIEFSPRLNWIVNSLEEGEEIEIITQKQSCRSKQANFIKCLEVRRN